MKTKGIIFDEGAESAARHLKNVQTKFVDLVSLVATKIHNLNVTPSRKMLHDAIYKDGQMLYDALMAESTMPDDKILASVVSSKISNQFADVINAANAITQSTDSIFNGQAVKNPALFDWIDVDANGCVKLKDDVVESIRDASRIYITTKEGMRMHELQMTIVKCIREIYETMDAIIENGGELHPTARFSYYYPNAGFCICNVDEHNGHRTIEPRIINFDPQ